MQIPTRCPLADDLRWGAAAMIAATVCLALVPLMPVIWLGGRCAHGVGR